MITDTTTRSASSDYVLVHPLIVRATHWINALVILIMILSGWRIYNASPIFDFKFPNGITLGGWLGGADVNLLIEAVRRQVDEVLARKPAGIVIAGVIGLAVDEDGIGQRVLLGHRG